MPNRLLIKRLSIGFILIIFISKVTYASIPIGTVVIGNQAFCLDYANNVHNQSEITQAFQHAIGLGLGVYIKAPNGSWYDNASGGIISPSLIPKVHYKDPLTGTISKYAAGDGSPLEPEDGKPIERITITYMGFLEIHTIMAEVSPAVFALDLSFTGLVGNRSTKVTLPMHYEGDNQFSLATTRLAPGVMVMITAYNRYGDVLAIEEHTIR